MNLRRDIVLLAICALSGCATDQIVPGPNGKSAHLIDCGTDPGECYKKAGKVCPNGYSLVNQHNSQTAMVPVGGSWLAASDTRLLVECKE